MLADLKREQVGPGVTFAPHGILVAPNDPDAMAEALRAMADPARRHGYADMDPFEMLLPDGTPFFRMWRAV